MAKLVSDRTAGRIMALLERADLGRGRRGGGAARWAFVRCDSETAVGGTGALAECYPATILLPSADSTCPPEDGGAVLLTLLTDAGAAAEPTEGAVYSCLITGEVFADRAGTGPDAENGRCRAFGLAPAPAPEGDTIIKVRCATTANVSLSLLQAGSILDTITLDAGDLVLVKDQTTATQNGVYLIRTATAAVRASVADTGAKIAAAVVAVSQGFSHGDSIWMCATETVVLGSTNVVWRQVTKRGTGTDNRIARWDGTRDIQDSQVTIDDFGLVSSASGFQAVGVGYSAFLDGSGSLLVSSEVGNEYPGLTAGLGGSVLIDGDTGRLLIGAPITKICIPNSGFTAMLDGYTGTLGPGMAAHGGLIVDGGSGSFVGTGTSNSFTNTNSFSGTTTFTGTVSSQNATTFTPTTAATVPATVQGAPSQSANLTEWKNSGGTVLASVSAAGALTAASLNGTYDAGTW